MPIISLGKCDSEANYRAYFLRMLMPASRSLKYVFLQREYLLGVRVLSHPRKPAPRATVEIFLYFLTWFTEPSLTYLRMRRFLPRRRAPSQSGLLAGEGHGRHSRKPLTALHSGPGSTKAGKAIQRPQDLHTANPTLQFWPLSSASRNLIGPRLGPLRVLFSNNMMKVNLSLCQGASPDPGGGLC